MKAKFLGVLACLCLIAPAFGQTAPAWRGYAGNAQHTATASAKVQKLKHLKWKTSVDLFPQFSGDTLLIHYASPMITASNTVLVPVKTGTNGGFRVEGHSGVTGKKVWKQTTDFILAPHDWTPSFPAHLTAQNRLYFAGAGGTVYYRDTPDLAAGTTGQIAFYGLSNYNANKNTYNAHVMIDTPITADEQGNIYFGFIVTGSTPLDLKSGIARIAADGTGTWISAKDAAGDNSMVEVGMNCAPAVSADQSTIYIGISDGGYGYLVGLDSTTLQPKYKVRVKDPSSGQDAIIYDNSSASPMVGPDGDVYYGVLENPFPNHNDRGWMLHFNADLTQTKTPGSFGWDNTVSVVPTPAVPSYTGSSPYLLMSKYNNYYGANTGDGHNQIAILDPDATQKDHFSNATVMKEVMTKRNPTQYPGAPPGVVYEWCINSAVVDPVSSSVFANAEDGQVYRWDLKKNKLTQVFMLNPPRAEAYTPTIAGPDGTLYAINDSTLYAIGK